MPPRHEELAPLLESIAGPDWHRQSGPLDPGRVRPDPSGRVFRALFDLGEIQEIQEAFARATGVASIITTTDGVPITRPSRFCALCQDVIRGTERGRANCFRSDAEIGRYNPHGPTIQTCLSGGLWDAGASITAGRIHIASWLIGQVRNEQTDTGRMRAYAGEIGADEQAVLRALQDVTVMSIEQFRQVSKALFLFANQVSQRAFQNLQLTHIVSELGRAEGILSRGPAVAFHRQRAPGWPVTFVTRNVERLLGYTAEDFLSGRVAYQKTVHPEDAARVQAEVARNLEQGRVREFAHEPYRVVARSGEVKWVTDITQMIRDPDGQVTALEGIVIDISERKRMEQEKAALESRLQRAHKMEVVGTLAGGVAHDLNNILGAIVGYPDLLLLDLPADSPLRKRVEDMRRSGERAADIVQDLLTLARRGVVVKEVTSLNGIVTGYLDSPEHRRLAGAHPGVAWETRLDPDLLNILGSPAHLTKTLMNVAANAAESMPLGGTVRICTENACVDPGVMEHDSLHEGDYAVLKIEDEGEGIPREDLERVFEPFYTRKVMGRSGTGLGMAVVWGTVKDHEGHITVDSVPGRGTCFRLHFPATRREASPAGASQPLMEHRGNGERILVIDDVEEQRDVAASLLEKLGYAVRRAASGPEALQALAREPADLLVLDMIMEPGWDGLETYRRILEAHPGQRAVIASGFSETERVRRAQGLGAGPYLKKPYTLARLGAAVRAGLSRRPAPPSGEPPGHRVIPADGGSPSPGTEASGHR